MCYNYFCIIKDIIILNFYIGMRSFNFFDILCKMKKLYQEQIPKEIEKILNWEIAERQRIQIVKHPWYPTIFQKLFLGLTNKY